MSRKTPANGSYTCPCCGYMSFGDDPGSHGICEICFWEDDEVQLRFATINIGANHVSLIEAQQNYMNFGACEKRLISHCTKPDSSDSKDKQWRVIDLARDKFPAFPNGDKDLEYPEDRRKLYYWRDDYWML